MMEQNTQNKITKSSSQVVHTGDEVIHIGFPQIAQIHADARTRKGFPQTCPTKPWRSRITQIHAELIIEILLQPPDKGELRLAIFKRHSLKRLKSQNENCLPRTPWCHPRHAPVIYEMLLGA